MADATENGNVLDLDALKAARLEALPTDRHFVFGGETYPIPPELPYETAWAWIENRGLDSIRILLNDDDLFERFAAARPSTDDMALLIEWLDKTYGGKKATLLDEEDATKGEGAASRTT